MHINCKCNLDFSDCSACEKQVDEFLDVIFVLRDLSEIMYTAYSVNETNGVYNIGFSCGGICHCEEESGYDLVHITHWSC